MSETAHATAVLAGARGVLIRGDSGAGKSTLALALIGGGARLVADDQVHLSACHGRAIAAAPAIIAGKIELRGRGIVTVPFERNAVIRLVVDIVSEEGLARLPEQDQFSTMLLGIELPRQPVPADSGRALRLLEAALRSFVATATLGLRSSRVWG